MCDGGSDRRAICTAQLYLGREMSAACPANPVEPSRRGPASDVSSPLLANAYGVYVCIHRISRASLPLNPSPWVGHLMAVAAMVATAGGAVRLRCQHRTVQPMQRETWPQDNIHERLMCRLTAKMSIDGTKHHRSPFLHFARLRLLHSNDLVAVQETQRVECLLHLRVRTC